MWICGQLFWFCASLSWPWKGFEKWILILILVIQNFDCWNWAIFNLDKLREHLKLSQCLLLIESWIFLLAWINPTTSHCTVTLTNAMWWPYLVSTHGDLGPQLALEPPRTFRSTIQNLCSSASHCLPQFIALSQVFSLDKPMLQTSQTLFRAKGRSRSLWGHEHKMGVLCWVSATCALPGRA